MGSINGTHTQLAIARLLPEDLKDVLRALSGTAWEKVFAEAVLLDTL